MTATPRPRCDRTYPHGVHQYVRRDDRGVERDYTCVGIAPARPLPMASFFRALLTGAEPGRHRGKAAYPEPAVVGPARHVLTEPHRCCESTCTEDHGSERSGVAS